MFLIVPNSLRDAIHAAIDKALLDVPEAAKDRDHFYEVLIQHFNMHSEIPEFSLVRNNGANQ